MNSEKMDRLKNNGWCFGNTCDFLLELSVEDSEMFVKALSDNSPPTEVMLRAVKKYKDVMQRGDI